MHHLVLCLPKNQLFSLFLIALVVRSPPSPDIADVYILFYMTADTCSSDTIVRALQFKNDPLLEGFFF